MAQKLQQNKRKHQDPLDQVTIETDNDSDSGRLDIQNDYLGMGHLEGILISTRIRGDMRS